HRCLEVLGLPRRRQLPEIPEQRRPFRTRAGSRPWLTVPTGSARPAAAGLGRDAAATSAMQSLSKSLILSFRLLARGAPVTALRPITRKNWRRRAQATRRRCLYEQGCSVIEGW